MAKTSSYKQYERQARRAVLDSDFSSGMMHSENTVDDGYLKSIVNFAFDKEGSNLVPRPSIHPHTVIFPDVPTEPSGDYFSDSVTIKDAKECVENGIGYSQFILGQLDKINTRKGEIWTFTSEAPEVEINLVNEDNREYDIDFSIGKTSSISHICYFYSAEIDNIHNVQVHDDGYKRMKFPVGTFAFGNSYYFIGEDVDNGPGLFRTNFNESSSNYEFEYVEPKKPTASEATTYGYNMLISEVEGTASVEESGPYVFNDKTGASVLDLQGILPYDSANPSKLLMTPKQNQHINFRCYYDAPVGAHYDIIWEWRETTASDWTVLQKDVDVTLDPNDGDKIEYLGFTPPAKDIMVRVSAYRYVGGQVTDIVEKGMTVGFDFNPENYGSASAIDPEIYDLTTATGIETWKDRLVLWGVPKDPTILFISDYNEPAYFPYPNNITVFDSPIIYAIEFMDNLAVFTTDKLYLVTLADDGVSWKSTLVQSHLHIDPWDKHLIQTVRNMLYFKSGNYYYMMVPKAQSTTGELTLAPITTPITKFFDNFSVNIQNILSSTYDYEDLYELITYYNFLDYEDIHNVYVFRFDESKALLYVDIIYSTVDRTWKVWVYENPNLLYPYRSNATETGLLASTTTLKAREIQNDGEITDHRFVQIFMLDKNMVRDYYIPKDTIVDYDTDYQNPLFEDNTLVFVSFEGDMYVTDHLLHMPYRIAREVVDHTLIIAILSDYYYGFYISRIGQMLNTVYENASEYFTFRNYQFIDTGYRDDEIQFKKRYRELQLFINNLDNKDMQFGMEYILDGSPRRIFYKYETNLAIDEMVDDYGVIYVDSTPFLEADISDIDQTNQWTLDQALAPEVAMWKIRVAVSGKGYTPRLKLYSRNEKRFELLNINWILKIMHMR